MPVYGYLNYHGRTNRNAKFSIEKRTIFIGTNQANDIRILSKQIEQQHIRIDVKSRFLKEEGNDFFIHTFYGEFVLDDP